MLLWLVSSATLPSILIDGFGKKLPISCSVLLAKKLVFFVPKEAFPTFVFFVFIGLNGSKYTYSENFPKFSEFQIPFQFQFQKFQKLKKRSEVEIFGIFEIFRFLKYLE